MYRIYTQIFDVKRKIGIKVKPKRGYASIFCLPLYGFCSLTYILRGLFTVLFYAIKLLFGAFAHSGKLLFGCADKIASAVGHEKRRSGSSAQHSSDYQIFHFYTSRLYSVQSASVNAWKKL
jgi:hypothetical protein